jgi:PPM family protein phosphatase
MTFALRYAVRSDVGLLREGNEDSAYAGPHLLAVADGMGGYEAGEVASSAVIKSVAPLDDELMSESELIDAIAAAVTAAKQNLRGIVAADPAVGSMGTTLTAMLWSGATAAICHIGDSRAYLLRAGDLYQITRDHTFVQALIDQGRIRPDEAATHPQRSLLLRALDGRTDAEPDLSLLTAELDDRFLLCSDGLPVAVTDEQILETLAEVPDPSQTVLQLIELAIRGGGPDNITCIVADVIDTDRSQVAPTKAPVIAGAAASIGPVASVGNAQTMQFSRPVDTDGRGMTTIGAGPEPGWPAEPGPPADQSLPRSSTRPGTVPGATKPRHAGAVAEPAQLAEDDYSPRRKRRRLPFMTVLIALFIVLVGGGLIVGYQVVRSQYYVSSDGGKVTIFRGINDKVLGVTLFSVYQRTDIPVSGITAAAAQELARADTTNLPMAQQFVANIRKQYNACQSAHAALRAWIAGKPKPVTEKKRVDGHTVTRKVTPPYHKPKPTIPSFCPPQPSSNGT